MAVWPEGDLDCEGATPLSHMYTQTSLGALPAVRETLDYPASGAGVIFERERSLLTTYRSESLNHRNDFSRPALRHGSLNSLFQVALYLPS